MSRKGGGRALPRVKNYVVDLTNGLTDGVRLSANSNLTNECALPLDHAHTRPMIFKRPSSKPAFDEQYDSVVTSLTMNVFFLGFWEDLCTAMQSEGRDLQAARAEAG